MSIPSSVVNDLSTPELCDFLGSLCDEMASRDDHDRGQLVGVLGRLGRAMGELGTCLGSNSTPPGHRVSPGASGHATRVDPALWLTMYGIGEERPGDEWRSLLHTTWTAYRAWYGSEGWQKRPTLEEGRTALAKHMPELVPIWNRLVELADDDPEVARMLTLWNPPAFAPGCSQIVVDRPERALLRNYDYDPDLFEGVSLNSRWRDRRVVGTSDCLWGLLDGMNDLGLVVSLTFGGLRGTGRGFAIPLVVRYLLEVCETVADVERVLARIPVAASYNLTVSDRSRRSRTLFVAPGRALETFEMPYATNHRGLVPDDPALAGALRSLERQDVLRIASRQDQSPEEVAALLTSPSLRSTRYESGFGTLYTADYRPDEGVVSYRWPDQVWQRSFDSPESEVRVRLR